MIGDISGAISESARDIPGVLFMGIDIGTTSISAAVTNGEDTVTFSVPNGCSLPVKENIYEQNANGIFIRVKEFADRLLDRYPSIRRVGFDGQMHGIVYTDRSGTAISNLVTWQDGRGDLPLPSGESACEKIYRLTGRKIYTGYGLATYLYDSEYGRIPDGASSFCTIGDYAVMRLCGNERPLIHPTNAASLGLFDIRNGCFDKEAVSYVGLDPDMLPEVSQTVRSAGEYRGVPVNIAVGDNQAAYYGVMPDGGVLCNFGTGSQVSVSVDSYMSVPGVECRPYFNGKYLLSGSALCGGRAYALLERFFREYTKSPDPQYKRLDELAAKGYAGGTALGVSTLFCGTREDPSLRGCIFGISEDNFTPEALAYGFIRGMAGELFGYYKRTGLPAPETVTVSGNAARKGETLRRTISDMFSAEARVSFVKEEAACGAALLARDGEDKG
ncbi:MAG: hypothetical protein IJT91_05730 [Clostridia bacterium]|nr:hypothetical protein [Clostridia bacterium]